MGALNISHACEAEADTVLDILAEASTWLHSKSIRQWPIRFDGRLILAGIEQAEVFLARYDGEVVGTITFPKASYTSAAAPCYALKSASARKVGLSFDFVPD